MGASSLSLSDKGASSWFSVLPIQDQISTHTNLRLRIPCALGTCMVESPLVYHPPGCMAIPCNVEHSLHCQHVGFTIHRCNDFWNHANFQLSKVYLDVSVEPRLQPLSEKKLTLISANQKDNVRLDVTATNFGLIKVNVPSSISGLSTPLLILITLSQLPLVTKSMSKRSNGAMTRLAPNLTAEFREE